MFNFPPFWFPLLSFLHTMWSKCLYDNLWKSVIIQKCYLLLTPEIQLQTSYLLFCTWTVSLQWTGWITAITIQIHFWTIQNGHGFYHNVKNCLDTPVDTFPYFILYRLLQIYIRGFILKVMIIFIKDQSLCHAPRSI